MSDNGPCNCEQAGELTAALVAVIEAHEAGDPEAREQATLLAYRALRKWGEECAT